MDSFDDDDSTGRLPSRFRNFINEFNRGFPIPFSFSTGLTSRRNRQRTNTNNERETTTGGLFGDLFGTSGLTDVLETQHQDMSTLFITDMLKAYPVSNHNTNKVVLPPSLLHEIHEKKVWDNRARDKPLIFELSVADPDTGDIIESTHVGVDNFTAPHGMIGLPYKTALSLTKELGVGWLQDNPLVFIRYVEVEPATESKMQVQPRGKGFFLEDESVVQLDIKTVLELTLKDHLVLTVGDWIPLFWQGNRFELVVKDLEPKEVIDVLNTDLTVDLLPSEEIEQSIKEREEAKQKVKEFMDKRELRYKEATAKLTQTPEPEKTDKTSELIRIKLPKGGVVQRRFSASSPFGFILDFVESKLYEANFTPMHLPTESLTYYFNLVYALPGVKKKVIPSNSECGSSLNQIRSQYGISAGPISFQIEMVKHSEETEQGGNTSSKANTGGNIVHVNNEWLKLADRLESNLQTNEEEVELNSESDVNEVKDLLSGVGVETELCEKVSRLYAKQVKDLITMGYSSPEQLQKVATLLNSKKGDLNGVVEGMLT